MWSFRLEIGCGHYGVGVEALEVNDVRTGRNDNDDDVNVTAIAPNRSSDGVVERRQ